MPNCGLVASVCPLPALRAAAEALWAAAERRSFQAAEAALVGSPDIPPPEWRPISYTDEFTLAEFETLQRGLTAYEMEDKWVAAYREPWLQLDRSWTRRPVFRVCFQADTCVARVRSAETTLADDHFRSTRYLVELLRFLLRALILGERLSFPVPVGTDEPAPGIFQHSLIGRGYPEILVPDDED